jgi:nucleotide-binding universal stress UspA family protein
MVGPQPLRRGRVLAAIDPNPEDPAEEALNLRIVEMGLYLTQAEYRELVILNVWNAFGTSLLTPLAPDDEVSAYVEAARESAGKDLDACLAPVRERLDKAILRLEEGEPGTFIPAFAASEEIDLVVMGTVARTGITGLLMGNTAERILGALSCSVLTVKPEGFRSPITLEDSPGG